jgi:hypothetical protein
MSGSCRVHIHFWLDHFHNEMSTNYKSLHYVVFLSLLSVQKHNLELSGLVDTDTQGSKIIYLLNMNINELRLQNEVI